MKRALASVYAVLFLCAAAMGNSLTLSSSLYSSGQGGEFKVTNVNPALQLAPLGANVETEGAAFQTFCIEHAEYFAPGHTYTYDVSTVAKLGNGTASPGFDSGTTDYRGHDNMDPISPATAYLFSEFWDGTLNLAGYKYDYDNLTQRITDAGALQDALWYLEGEKTEGEIGVQAKAWADAAIDKTKGTTYLYGVRVLNLTDRNNSDGLYPSYALGIQRQDQLVKIVPLPAAAATTLAGLGMLLAGAAIRRIRNRAA